MTTITERGRIVAFKCARDEIPRDSQTESFYVFQELDCFACLGKLT